MAELELLKVVLDISARIMKKESSEESETHVVPKNPKPTYKDDGELLIDNLGIAGSIRKLMIPEEQPTCFESPEAFENRLKK